MLPPSTTHPPIAASPPAQAVKVDFSARLRERNSARRRLVAYRVAVAVALVAVVLGGFWAVFASPLLALQSDKISVQGVQSAEADSAIVPVVNEYVGKPLPRVSTSAIRDELLALPLVYDADVRRAWPRGLTVTIEPRLAAGMVVTDGGYALVGPDGVTTAVVPDPVEGLPVIHVTATDADKITSQASSAVAVWRSLPTALQEQVTSFSVNGYVVSIELTSGAQVVWGTSEESDVKAEVLALLVEQRPATVYDLRDPRQPVTR